MRPKWRGKFRMSLANGVPGLNLVLEIAYMFIERMITAFLPFE
jgi:hypothetical protein